MVNANANEEILEVIWFLREKNETPAIDTIIKRATVTDAEQIVGSLEAEGLVVREGQKVLFTISGEKRARLLIRSHRIAERLIYDVLNSEFESGACEFEHITNIGLVDAICTMLGHPKECPHGFPIPEGECCKASADTVKRAVIPLTELTIGQSATVAFVYSKNDQQLHIVEGLQIKPGAAIKLHQRQPTFVIEVEDAHIALDREIAANIQVWLSTLRFVPVPHAHQHARGRGQESRRRNRGDQARE